MNSTQKESAAKAGAVVSTQTIVSAVLTVIGDYKNISPFKIALADELAKHPLMFSLTERRDLAQKINLYFYNRLQLVFDTLLDGARIDDEATTVGKVVQEVEALHPRHR